MNDYLLSLYKGGIITQCITFFSLIPTIPRLKPTQEMKPTLKTLHFPIILFSKPTYLTNIVTIPLTCLIRRTFQEKGQAYIKGAKELNGYRALAQNR